MLKTISFANALGIVSGIAWLVCFLFVAFFPDFSMNIVQALSHGLDLSVLGNWQLTLGNFFVGLIISVITAWLFGLLLAWLYNRLVK